MEIFIADQEQFLDALFKHLGSPAANGGKSACLWAVTYGAFEFSAYVTGQAGEVVMLLDTAAAGDFIFTDWYTRHAIQSDLTYEQWLQQRDAILPGSWNWGWAAKHPDGRRELHLYTDLLGPEGLPDMAHVQQWRKAQFGSAPIVVAEARA
jgi:hypothetical protein